MVSLANYCPICSSSNLSEFHSYPKFNLSLCRDCDLVFQNRIDLGYVESMVSEIYNDEWIAMRNKYVESSFYDHALFNNLLLEIYCPEKGTLLEIGSGTGEFLFTTSEAGWDTVGIEPSEVSCKFALEKFGMHLTHGFWDLKLFPEDLKFDVIVFWHVLEHIPEPVSFLKQVSSLLKENGKIIFSIPNKNSLTNQIYGADSALFTEEDHLFHYSIKNLPILLENADLKKVSIFSRQNPKEFGNKGMKQDLKEQVSMMAKSQANYQGHELICVATL